MIDTEEQNRKSKSQIKRELRALKELGQKLVVLPEKSLKKIPMTDALREAVMEAKQFRRNALHRQLQYIGVLMRDEDGEVIRKALANLMQPHEDEIQAFHEVEQWRDTLLAGDDDLLDTLCNRFTQVDRQHLRQLVRNARKERKQDNPPKSARALFRYLSELQQKQ